MVERFAVLGVLFAVVGGKAAQRDRDQVAAPLQIFQQQRRAQLLRCADGLTVEALILSAPMPRAPCGRAAGG